MHAESILEQRTNEEEADSQEACLRRPVYVYPAAALIRDSIMYVVALEDDD